MSKENEVQNDVDEQKDNVEDSEESTEEQGDEDVETLKKENQTKDEKIKELEALIVKNKKESKDSDDSDDDSKDEDSPYITKDEVVLLKELDVEDLDKLKSVQKGFGFKTLKEAKESDIFTAYLEKRDREQKSKDASLGASKGSGKGEGKFKPGMSREEHKQQWKKE